MEMKYLVIMFFSNGYVGKYVKDQTGQENRLTDVSIMQYEINILEYNITNGDRCILNEIGDMENKETIKNCGNKNVKENSRKYFAGSNPQCGD